MRQLAALLETQQATYEAARKERAEAKRRSRRNSGRTRLEAADNALSLAQYDVEHTQRLLRQWGRPPEAVIQPLPQSPAIALRWLFFLHMPPLFRALSRATFLAQQLLLPPDVDLPPVDWKSRLASHYNAHQASAYAAVEPRQGHDGAVLLVSSDAAIEPTRVGPSHVNSYTTPQHGVWHPDGMRLGMGWQGSGSKADAWTCAFDPFLPVTRQATVDAFTEQLPEEAIELQWAMPQYGTAATPADRGNLAIATQDARPHWLSKPGYLDFGALRAYPCLQLRKLCVALHERSLPLGHPAVQTLVRQALYHLGTFTDAAKPALAWRTEWDATKSDLLPVLCEEVGSLADELSQMPRSYESVTLLGEVAAYLSDWHAPFLPLARRFGVMAAEWADDLEVTIQDAAAENSKHVRAKQCLLRMSALVSYANGELSVADVAAMVRLMVLIAHGRVFEEEDALQGEIAAMHVRCCHVMAKRSTRIQEAQGQEPAILLAAVRGVLRRAPADLVMNVGYSWAKEGIVASRKDGTGSDGHLYSINYLTGTVLLDGWPHKRLPAEIVGHPLYQRTFGSWNFEVAGRGVHKTSRPVRGRFYEFYLAGEGAEGELVVIEVDDRGQRLQLMDVGENGRCGSWGTAAACVSAGTVQSLADQVSGVSICKSLYTVLHTRAKRRLLVHVRAGRSAF